MVINHTHEKVSKATPVGSSVEAGQVYTVTNAGESLLHHKALWLALGHDTHVRKHGAVNVLSASS